MPNDEYREVTRKSIPDHIPLDMAMALLRLQVKDNISPIGLDIDCGALRTWSEEKGLDRFRHKHLIQEIKSWSHLLAHKPITRISLKDPFLILDPPSLTELVYAIGHHLRVLVGARVDHSATLKPQQVNSENLALLKGLNFNHIVIFLDKTTTIESLAELNKRIAEFKIPFFSLLMDEEQPSADYQLQLMELLSFLQPETIQLGSNIVHRLRPNKLMSSMLMQFGYYFMQGRYIIKFKSPLSNIPHDKLRLGPQSLSQLGQLCTKSFEDPEEYFSYVHKGLIPVASCR